jgi:hypothetical protein
LIASHWHAEPQGVKDIWFNKAAEAKAEHMRKYPEYQYKPRKSSERKRRAKKAAASNAIVIEVQAPHTITKLDGSPSQDSSNLQGFEPIQPIQPIQPIAPIRPLKPLQPLQELQALETVQTFQVFADQGADNVQGVEVQAGNNNVELGAGTSGVQAIGARIDLEAENVEFGDFIDFAAMDHDAEAGNNVHVNDRASGVDAIGAAAMDLDVYARDNGAELGDLFAGANYANGELDDYLQGLINGGADDIALATHARYYGVYEGGEGEDFADGFFSIENEEELAAYDEEYDRRAQEHLDDVNGLFDGNY